MPTGRVEGEHFSNDQEFLACQNSMTAEKIQKSQRDMAAQSFKAKTETGWNQEFGADESFSGRKGFDASRKILVALTCSTIFSTSLFFDGTAFAETVNDDIKIANNGKQSKPSIANKKQNATGEKAATET
ncbi:hypothetical protein [Bartonella apis]|uniref:Uncharacterized protein n=1 Tax=Bartonella apis TaxID=1686310 RepID=A0A1R0FA24_9HYPH|nr:hypothetical protein [Bartonella apis]OLY43834.1 hypothetical protein PEB0149_012720 [Bartonella apis]